MLMIEGAVIFAVGSFVGWLIGRSSRQSKVPRAVKAICSCGDPLGQHVDGKGECQAVHAFVDGIRTRSLVSCTCQVYDGPERLPQMYAPEIEG